MKRLCIFLTALVTGIALSERAYAQEPPIPSAPPPSSPEVPETKAETVPAALPVSALVPTPSSASFRSAYVAPGEAEGPHDPEEPSNYVPTKPNAWLRFGLGARVGYSPNAGLDPFSKNDAIGQVSFEVSRTLLARGKGSLAIGLGWDVGSKTATARGVSSGITAHRVLVPIEGRYHLFSWLYGFAKVAPGFSLIEMRVKDSSAPTSLYDARPGFALDASAGASFLIAGHGPADRKRVRLWASPELGYGWTTSGRPNLTVDSREDVLGREEGASMAPIAVRGFFFRFGLGLTY